MSLWHADRDSNPEKRKVKNLPNFEPLPELDDLLDEFDSEKKLAEGNNLYISSENTEVDSRHLKEETSDNNKFTLPSPDEDEFGDKNEDSYLASSEEIASEENSEENIEDENLYIDEDIENQFEEGTNLLDTEDFVDLSDENLEEDENEIFEDFGDEEYIDDEDFNNESLNEEDLEGKFGLIPMILDESETEESEEEKNKKDDSDNISNKTKKKENKGFKELDEERVKEFFTNLFSKFPKLKKEGNLPKEQKDESPSKIKKPRKNKGLNKKILILIGAPIIATLILFAVYSFWSNSYVSINELRSTNEENTKISLSNFSQNDEGLNVTVKNNDDISKGFSFYITLKQKAAIPFTSSKIECESDIIDITSGNEITETLRCTKPLGIGEKYKISNIENVEL